jgi:hypothetical protein
MVRAIGVCDSGDLWSFIGWERAGSRAFGCWARLKGLLKTTESRRRNRYTSRWQVETGNSMIKRNQGDALAGKSPASRKRDMRLRVLTHNMMIL